MPFPGLSSVVRTSLLVLVLAAAAPLARAQSAPDAETSTPAQTYSPEVMYRILVGEIALQRGEAALAARAYYEAARDAQDPTLARRATEIALFARQRGLAMDAAQRVSEDHLHVDIIAHLLERSSGDMVYRGAFMAQGR